MTTIDKTKENQDFAERALRLVREKLSGRDLVCQLCGQSRWNVDSQPAFVIALDLDTGMNSLFVNSEQRGLPLVAVTCKNCGNTLFVNTVILGLGNLNEHDKHDPHRHG